MQCPYSRLRGGSHWSQILMCQIDAIVDKQLPLLEMYATAIGGLDTTMVEAAGGPTSGHVGLSMKLKRKVQSIRHHAWQWRDLLMELKQNQYGLLPFGFPGWEFAAVHVIDLIDSTIINCAEQSEMSAGWIARCAEMDIFFERFLDNRMGDMLYVLTLASVVILPIQTMSGIYGMNFINEDGDPNIPILVWKWGYLYFWLCGIGLSALVLGLLWWAGMLRATKKNNKVQRNDFDRIQASAAKESKSRRPVRKPTKVYPLSTTPAAASTAATAATAATPTPSRDKSNWRGSAGNPAKRNPSSITPASTSTATAKTPPTPAPASSVLATPAPSRDSTNNSSINSSSSPKPTEKTTVRLLPITGKSSGTEYTDRHEEVIGQPITASAEVNDGDNTETVV